jgi:hypothetical protein
MTEQTTDPRAEAVAQIRQEFAHIILAVTLAAQGHKELAEELTPVLNNMTQRRPWQQLAAALRRILAGERDAQSLMLGLDLADRVVVADILEKLGAENVTTAAPERALTLPQFINGLLNGVLLASKPDAPDILRDDVETFTQKLAEDETAPPDLRALGRILHDILNGDRDPDMRDLPPELTAVVHTLLSRLGGTNGA